MSIFTLHKSTGLCTKPARRGWLLAVADMLAVARQRRHLSRLDTHQLRDIGLSEHQARTEAEKPIWDTPSYWQR